MPDFVSSMPPVVLTVSSPDPITSLGCTAGDDPGDRAVQVTVGATVPWSFDIVLHADDTITPAPPAGITVTVTRP